MTGTKRERDLDLVSIVDFFRAVVGDNARLITPSNAAALLGSVMQLTLPDGQSGLLAEILSQIKIGAANGILGVETYAELLDLTGSIAPGIMREVTNDLSDDPESEDPADHINGVYLRDLDAPDGWRKTADRTSALRTDLTATKIRVGDLEAEVPLVLPNAGIFLNVGKYPLAMANALGTVFAGLLNSGYWYLLKGLILGDTTLSVVKDDPNYVFALMDQWGVVRLGLRRDGALVLAGSRMRVTTNPVWAIAITNRWGIVFFGIRRNGTCYAKGLEGGGGTLPTGLLEQLEAIIDFEEAFQNTDATLSPAGGGDPVDSIPRMQRLQEERMAALIADVNADVAAAVAPNLPGPVDAYAPATAYVLNDLVTSGGITYRVTGAYTSVDLATDIANGDLVVFAGITADTLVGTMSVSDYSGLRAYTGPMIRMEVRTPPFAGIFRERIGDTTSADDGGGIIVGATGRRWERVALVGLASGRVTYEMFGADQTGIAVADTAMQNCHAFANARALEVHQHSGTFLWRALSCEVRYHMDLRGAKIRLDSLSGVSTPDWYTGPKIWCITGKAKITLDSGQLEDLNDNYSQYFKMGSARLPYPDIYQYYGGRIMFRSSAVWMYRNGNTTDPDQEVRYDDHARIGREGALTDPIETSIPDGTLETVLITQREDSWLTVHGPKLIGEAARAWTAFNIERAMVTLDGLVCAFENTPQNIESRQVVRLEDTFDVRLYNLNIEGNPGGRSGYGIISLGCLGLEIRGLSGGYGWGLTGTKWTKNVTIRDSWLNRIDAHESAFGTWIVENTSIRNIGVRIMGGGRLIMRDCTWVIAPDIGVDDLVDGSNEAEHVSAAFVLGRADYMNHYAGEIVIERLRITFDGPSLGWTDGGGPDNLSNNTSLDIVRLGDPNIANGQSDTYMPVIVRVIDPVWDFAGMPSIPDRLRFCSVRMVRAGYSAILPKKTFLPIRIEARGGSAINVPEGSNAILDGFIQPDMATNVDGARRARRFDGTNADVLISDMISVVNKTYIPSPAGLGAATYYAAGNPAAWGGSYTSATKRWVPRVEIVRCFPTVVETTAECRVTVDGGTLSRVDTGALPGFVNQSTPSGQVDVRGAEVQLIPKTAGADPVLTAVATVTFSICTFKDHLGGSTAPIFGAFRGSGNINRATAGVFPGVGGDFFIP